MAEEGDDVFHGLLHAIELGKFGVAFDDFIGKDA